MLERVAGQEVPVDVAARDAVHARERDEVGVGAERIERVELDAAQPREERAHALRARREGGRREGVVPDEPRARLGGREREGAPQRALPRYVTSSAIASPTAKSVSSRTMARRASSLNHT